jgi:hypothetical protein
VRRPRCSRLIRIEEREGERGGKEGRGGGERRSEAFSSRLAVTRLMCHMRRRIHALQLLGSSCSARSALSTAFAHISSFKKHMARLL